MTKKMEALAMLNVAFESHDGRPVEQAIITAADYRLLFEALMENHPEDGLLEPADKMAEGIRRAVQSGALDSRSMAADSELIYTARRKQPTPQNGGQG